MIPKTSANSLADSRPISIVPLFRALFEKGLLPFLDHHLNRLHPAQIGFRPNQSTLSHLKAVHQSKARVKVFIDYAKAFDSPYFSDLRQSWATFGLPEWIQRLLASLYTRSMSCKLVVNGCHSPIIHRTKGIFQGTVLSPHLFNIFTDELVRRLNPNNPHSSNLLAYADDHVLLCSTLTEAKDFLRIAIAWAAPKGLNINGNKSAILDREHPDAVLHMDMNLTIRSSRKTTYLGLPFTIDGIDWEDYITQNIKEASSHLRLLLYQTRSWPLMTRVHLYRTFVKPQLEYGSALFALQTVDLDYASAIHHEALWEKLHTFHRYGSRLICRQKQDNRLLATIIGESSPIKRARELTLRAFLHAAPFTLSTPTPAIIDTFSASIDDNDVSLSKTTLTKRLASFLEPPRPEKTIDHHLQPSTQEHLLHWLKKTFAYKHTCLCGSPFSQITHTNCLPQPHGDMVTLLATKHCLKIDDTFKTWWELLPLS